MLSLLMRHPALRLCLRQVGHVKHLVQLLQDRAHAVELFFQSSHLPRLGLDAGLQLTALRIARRQPRLQLIRVW